jgi:hypothetical protein
MRSDLQRKPDKDLCKGGAFPESSVCQVCYSENVTETETQRTFKSGRSVLRYLYGVYTNEKLL